MTSPLALETMAEPERGRPLGAKLMAEVGGGQGTRNERVAALEKLLGRHVCRGLGIFPLPEDFVLSVVIPVYNEVQTVEHLVDRVQASEIPTEVVLVDDGSTDGTRDVLKTLEGRPGVRVFYHAKNQGKGAALRSGFQHATGTAVIIQDADLEYNPDDYGRLVQPIVEGIADVVFGNRFSGDCQRVLYFWHFVANKLLTTFSNFFTNLNLSDMETCYKVFRREIIQQVAPTLRENRFGIEPEITAKIAKIKGVRVYERPISYRGRTYEQGKKIGWKDAVSALRCIVRYH